MDGRLLEDGFRDIATRPEIELRDSELDGIGKALDAVRRHLDMDVGFISEFLIDERVFHHVSSASSPAPISVGQRLSFDRGYCRKVVDGEIPQIIADTGVLPALQEIAETRLLPIGSHLSVPIRLGDGTVYGTICCFSSDRMPTLNERDLKTLGLVADLIATQIDNDAATRRLYVETIEAIRTAILAAEPIMVYQPVVELADRKVIGAEALSRFSKLPYRAPDRWFADAGTVGMRSDLEIVAIRNAVAGYTQAWQNQPQLYLSINASASTVLASSFFDAFNDAPLDRIIIEVTEHDQVDDYDHLERSLAPLRERGAKVAVDDAGSGYASLRHILNIRPDIIKLDISLTKDIDKDPVRRALTAAVVQFAGQTGSVVLAEGIETEAEVAAMLDLGVGLGQGYLLGRPGPVANVLEANSRCVE